MAQVATRLQEVWAVHVVVIIVTVVGGAGDLGTSGGGLENKSETLEILRG